MLPSTRTNESTLCQIDTKGKAIEGFGANLYAGTTPPRPGPTRAPPLPNPPFLVEQWRVQRASLESASRHQRGGLVAEPHRRSKDYTNAENRNRKIERGINAMIMI
jgi:hypothetical protein